MARRKIKTPQTADKSKTAAAAQPPKETKAKTAPETVEDAPQQAPPAEEAVADVKPSRVRKTTKRQKPKAPPPDPFPNGKQYVWVRNTADRPCVVGVKYLSPGETRSEPWRHIKAVGAANPGVLEWRRGTAGPWLQIEDPGE